MVYCDKTKVLTKCDFCKYYSGQTCLAKMNSVYCKDANNEFYAYLSGKKQSNTTVKSLYNKNRSKR